MKDKFFPDATERQAETAIYSCRPDFFPVFFVWETGRKNSGQKLKCKIKFASRHQTDGWQARHPIKPAKIMKALPTILVIGLMLCLRADGQTHSTPPAAASGATVETIVCLRHGEKPPGGLGQLTCRGLHRALALPKVLLAKFGPPQFIFAPNPTQKVDGNRYYYVRPLMTIEPTAICCGLPVDTQFGYREIKGLESELRKPAYRRATIFVAWEHGLLDDFVKAEVKAYGGDPAQVPAWSDDEYDAIFILRIAKNGGQASVSFTIDHENLNNLSDACP
jgi:hypothetical protein